MESEALQAKLNEQITHELGAEMQYLAMSFWFERENLNGMANSPNIKALHEEREKHRTAG